jgi:hypothetical protein
MIVDCLPRISDQGSQKRRLALNVKLEDKLKPSRN